ATIAAGGGVVATATPMDGKLAELGRKLDDTAVVYGDAPARERVAAKSRAAAAAPAAVAADRGAHYAPSGASLPESDVLEKAAEGGGAGLAKLEAAKLPEPMKAMSVEERKGYVMKQKQAREDILRSMRAVSAERDAYLKDHQAKTPTSSGEGAFDDA